MDNESTLSEQQIESRIYTIRGVQVMLDSDIAQLYNVETRALNQAVKRNLDRFPSDFMFQLTRREWDHLKSQIVISSDHGGRRVAPFVFTEQGVASLSGILKSKTAIKVHIAILRAFIQMRKFIYANFGLLQRMEGIERKQIETDQKIEFVFQALEDKSTIPSQAVFFDGQMFDAYKLASGIIRSATKSIVLIDNYIDENTLILFAKKKTAVEVLLLTKNINPQLQMDVRKANEQFGNFGLQRFDKSHDRFSLIDQEDVYHIGASLKDLGKKWFAFSRLSKETVADILKQIKHYKHIRE